MHIEFTHTRDRSYARRLLAAHTLGHRIFTGIIGIVMLLTGGLTLGAGHPWASLGSVIALGLGLCWVIKPVILPWQWLARLPDYSYQPRSYLLTDDEVAWQSAAARTTLNWNVFVRVRKKPFAFLLDQAGGLAVFDIPRSGLTADQERELAAFLTKLGPSEA